MSLVTNPSDKAGGNCSESYALAEAYAAGEYMAP